MARLPGPLMGTPHHFGSSPLLPGRTGQLLLWVQGHYGLGIYQLVHCFFTMPASSLQYVLPGVGAGAAVWSVSAVPKTSRGQAQTGQDDGEELTSFCHSPGPRGPALGTGPQPPGNERGQPRGAGRPADHALSLRPAPSSHLSPSLTEWG